jgi:hypothetical protein
MRGASSLVASGRSSNPVEPRQCPGPVGQPVGMGMAVGSPEGMAGKLLGRPVGMGKLDGMAGRPEGIAGKPDGIPGRAVGKPEGNAVGIPQAIPPSAAGVPAAVGVPGPDGWAGAGPGPPWPPGESGGTAVATGGGLSVETVGGVAAVTVAVSAAPPPELAFCWLQADAARGKTPRRTSRPAAMLLIDAEGNA